MKRRLRRIMAILTASTLLSCTVMGNITIADNTQFLPENAMAAQASAPGAELLLNASDAAQPASPADAFKPTETSPAGTGSNAEYRLDEDGHIMDGAVFDDVTVKAFVPTVSCVDESGVSLGSGYKDMELPEFDDELILDDPENAPVDDVIVREGDQSLRRTVYSYQYATADGEQIAAIRKVMSSELYEEEDDGEDPEATASDASRVGSEGTDETEVYTYTPDGDFWVEFTEDTELLFVFAQEGLTSYVYEDDDITVTAELQYAGAIPAGVELKVTPITEKTDGYNYDAYMQALNDNAAEIADPGKAAKNYSESNTLLYDIAFIRKNSDGTEVEYEPEEGSVRVKAEFHQRQLTRSLKAEAEEKIDVIHLPLTEEVKETIDSTKDAVAISAADIAPEKVEDITATLSGSGKESVEFTTDSFSLFAFTYTVDFTYDGYTWSFPGKGSYALSEVLSALGIDAEADSASLKLIAGEEHEGALYLTEDNGVWYIHSDRAFSDTYELSVVNGNITYLITVTDAVPTSTDLEDFLVNAVLTGVTQDSEGNYQVTEGVEYTVALTFREDSLG